MNEIYDDIDYLKDIIKNYSIKYPIYLNVDSIIENNKDDQYQTAKLINAFLVKCSANGLYTAVYGTDSNLCKVQELVDISNYDAMPCQEKDKDTIAYQGTYYLKVNKNGHAEATTNNFSLADVITKAGLNNSSKFIEDDKYTYTDSDNIADIAEGYGLTKDELLAYNDTKEADLVDGTQLIIPSSYNEATNKIRKGIDLSKFQDASKADWSKIKDNAEFAIIRCSAGNREDECFSTYSTKCQENNIPIGVYCCNECSSTSVASHDEFVAQVDSEINTTLNLINNSKLNYPVYLDLESIDNLSKDDLNYLLDEWYAKVTATGNKAGIYCNKDTFRQIISKIGDEFTSKYEKWIAGGNQYTDICNVSDITDPGNKITINGTDYQLDMRQVSNSVTNLGIGNSAGLVDYNICYKDYTKKAIKSFTDGIKVSATSKTNSNKASNPAVIPIIVASSIGLGYVGYRKIRR
jgi:hypothetical protein